MHAGLRQRGSFSSWQAAKRTETGGCLIKGWGHDPKDDARARIPSLGLGERFACPPCASFGSWQLQKQGNSTAEGAGG